MKDLFNSIGPFWQGVLASAIAAILLAILYRVGNMFITTFKESKNERKRKNTELKEKLLSKDSILRIDGNFQILFHLLQYILLAIISLVIAKLFEFAPLVFWILIVFSLWFFLVGLNDIFRIFRITRQDSAFIKYSIVTRFTIDHAEYGSSDSYLDVTDILKTKIIEDHIEIEVSNDIGGDPLPGARKKLIVLYTVNKETYKRIIPEGKVFRAP